MKTVIVHFTPDQYADIEACAQLMGETVEEWVAKESALIAGYEIDRANDKEN